MAASLQEYEVGATLSLTRLPHKAALSSRTIRVRIRELKTRSCCCTMAVDIISKNNSNSNNNKNKNKSKSNNCKPKPAFLKLHNWRYADTLRQHMGMDRWSPSTESAYIRAVDSHARRTASIHVHDDQDAVQSEAPLAGILGKSFANEAAVYGALRAHQGRTLPRLLAAVDLDLTPAGAENYDLFHVQGLLLESLDDVVGAGAGAGAFSLRTLPRHAPRDAWQGLVDAAVDAGRLLGKHGVLDPDRHAGNFMVVPRADGGFRVVMIDFGHCRFKQKEESEQAWRGMLAANEIVGEWMRSMLARRHGFELCYRGLGS